jgi:predicted transcriptional regulator
MSASEPQMTTTRKKKSNKTVRARVEPDLKNRLEKYRMLPTVRRSEGFIVREALEQFLNRNELNAA